LPRAKANSSLARPFSLKFERHQSHALALDRADQFVDLSPMQQPLS
jgi:hypothetical protein